MTPTTERPQPTASSADHCRKSAQLQQLPNIDQAAADDLLRLGITGQDDLVGRDPQELYETLCRLDGVRHDPCLVDVFTAAVAYAEGGPPTPWYEFTSARRTREEAIRREGARLQRGGYVLLSETVLHGFDELGCPGHHGE